MPDAGILPGALDIVTRHGAALVAIAAGAIRHAVAFGDRPRVALDDYPAALRDPGASFVTLRRHGSLRGCIGSVMAERALAADVAHNAQAAAFADPRFPPLQADELPGLAIEVSVLTAPEPFPVADEAELLARLRPGRDGLILADGNRRGLFLPSVWDILPEPADFLGHLKTKAGLEPDHWSSGIRFARFETCKAAGIA